MVDYRTEAPSLVRDFLRFEKTNHDLSDKTINEYFLDLRMFFRFMKQERGIAPPDQPFDAIEIKDIDLDFIKGVSKYDINSYVDFLRSDRHVTSGGQHQRNGLESVTTRRKLSSVRSFFHYMCEDAELLDHNPTLSAVTPKLRKTLPVYLTEEESASLLEGIVGRQSDRDYCIILIALCCGLRVSEIVSINLSDIRMLDSEQAAYLLVHGKGGKQREVFLPQNCVDAIEAYLRVRDEDHAAEDAKDALFLSQKHGRISTRAVQNLVEKATKQAGIRSITPHKLRHTAATIMMSHGTNIRAVQEVLGHSSISTTQKYTHVASQNIRESIESSPLTTIQRNTEIAEDLEDSER